MMQKENLLIPAMLDAHFPLMKYAFYSRRYQPVILNNRRDVTELGLRWVHNDMCYPCILNTGQMLGALRSGRFDPAHTRLLMPTVGDACRGSNYADMIRRAVRLAGYPQTRVMTMNLRHVDDGNQLGITPLMVWRALFSLYYGDLLLILVQQVRPHELHRGDTNRLRDQWHATLGRELKSCRNLRLSVLRRRFREITASFAAIPRDSPKKQRIGLVGDLYTRYCSLGNWDIVSFLERSGCESYTNGLSWYVLYYIDSHLREGNPAETAVYRAAELLLTNLQDAMIEAIRSAGFFTLPRLKTVKAEAKGAVPLDVAIGDGWLIGAEAAAYLHHADRKVLAIQPFGCMANHVCGRGIYASVQRKCGGAVVSADVDASGTPVNVYNRARMLIDLSVDLLDSAGSQNQL